MSIEELGRERNRELCRLCEQLNPLLNALCVGVVVLLVLAVVALCAGELVSAALVAVLALVGFVYGASICFTVWKQALFLEGYFAAIKDAGKAGGK